jgi:hypothetical protein
MHRGGNVCFYLGRTKAQVLTGSKIKKTEHISVDRTEMQPGTPQQSNQVHSEVNLALTLARPHQIVPKEIFSQRYAIIFRFKV